VRVKVGRADIPSGEKRGFPLPNGRNVLVVNLGGRFHALDDWCNHAGCLLSGGTMRGEAIVCPCHEMAFDIPTGRLVTEPRLCDDQRVMAVAVEDGELWIEL
jgi:3-phenylpropionate/trans-cinnamate dioxygenase ferredoxin subunit